MEEATVIAGLVSAFAIVASLLFLARQTHQSVEQFVVANELAGGTIRSFTRDHPLQYPFLARMLNEIESATAED